MGNTFAQTLEYLFNALCGDYPVLVGKPNGFILNVLLCATCQMSAVWMLLTPGTTGCLGS